MQNGRDRAQVLPAAAAFVTAEDDAGTAPLFPSSSVLVKAARCLADGPREGERPTQRRRVTAHFTTLLRVHRA
jgi:hypothetical protein